MKFFTHGLSLSADDMAEIAGMKPGAVVQCEPSAIIVPMPGYFPDPRTPAGGYESIDWTGCRLADLYGVPGEVRCGQRRSKLR